MKQFYYELKITPTKYYELYLDLILSLTPDAIEELDSSIIIRSEEKLDEIISGIEYFTQELSNSLNDKIECNLEFQTKDNEDWISKYKNAIKSITIEKFHIHPSWEKQKENKINIQIDPALAFGSGHHETTSSCLEIISKYVKQEQTLIDVGSGSGILAIAASKLGANCDICDTDPLAIENAIENFKLNTAKLNDSWIGSAIKSNKTYDIVVANIVADVLILINKDLKKVLKDDGILILSGILENYLDKVIAKFNDFNLIESIKKNEWRTIILKRKND